MPNEILQKAQTAIVIANAGDYAGDIGGQTDQIDLTGVLATEARESDKVDLGNGAALLATRFAVFVALEFAVAPGSGEVFDFYVGFSPSVVAGTANPGGLVGADGDYAGTGGDSLDDSLKQLDFIGSLVVTSDVQPAVQFQFIGWFVAAERYASFVADNNTAQALDADAIEMGIRIVPYLDEVQ